MKTLVTGGTGFLGAKLVERLLSEGREVTVLARRPLRAFLEKGVRFVTASLDDADAVASACAGQESVFHVAARVGVGGAYHDFFRTNVLGTRAVIDGCRRHSVKALVYTSTPSVVYNGADLAGANESLPLTTECPAAYPVTKAIAESAIREANSTELATVALRPHLIWGVGDPHLVPRVIARAKAGQLRIVGDGKNRVDMVHVENAVDAHLLAEAMLLSALPELRTPVAGRAFFITNNEPVVLWEWINALLSSLEIPPVRRRVSLATAYRLGWVCEQAWRWLPLKGEPPMTRFMATELAKNHWFDISAARKALRYQPRISMAAGTAELIASLR